MQKTQFRGSFKRKRLKIYCKNKHLFLINKVAAPSDKKVPAYRKKRTHNPGEESITDGPFENPVTEDHKEGPITEDHKEGPITEESKKHPITKRPKENTLTENPEEESQGPQ